jgi:hypothetical protein
LVWGELQLSRFNDRVRKQFAEMRAQCQSFLPIINSIRPSLVRQQRAILNVALAEPYLVFDLEFAEPEGAVPKREVPKTNRFNSNNGCVINDFVFASEETNNKIKTLILVQNQGIESASYNIKTGPFGTDTGRFTTCVRRRLHIWAVNIDKREVAGYGTLTDKPLQSSYAHPCGFNWSTRDKDVVDIADVYGWAESAIRENRFRQE